MMEQDQLPRCKEVDALALEDPEEEEEEEEEEEKKSRDDCMSPHEEKCGEGGDAAVVENEPAVDDGDNRMSPDEEKCGDGGDTAVVEDESAVDDSDDRMSTDEEKRGDAAVVEDKHAVDDGDDDNYECKICGYKAANVCSFSQHLHSAHPVTSLPGPSSPTSEKSVEKEDGDAGGSDTGGGESDSPSVVEEQCPLQERMEFPQESMSSIPKDSEESSRTTCAVENHLSEVEQSKTIKNRTEIMVSQSTSPASILPGRKTSGSSGSSKKRQNGDAASSGTPTLNRTPLVCLPLVSEGLKLLWVRSEQTHELDGISDLVKAFNAFPYPTEQEASALARRCSLSSDQVKVWFMMQRVRYGISWGEGDIHETRVKLQRMHQTQQENGCEDEEEENGFRDVLENKETSPEGPQQDRKQCFLEDTYTGQASQIPITVADMCNNSAVEQHSTVAHYTNGLEQFVPHLNEGQFANTLDPSSLHDVYPQSHNDLNHILPHNSENLCPDDVYPPQFDSAINHGTMELDLPAEAEESGHRAPAAQLRKKSKAQLLVLRRSFVNRNWPPETEVQRLQRVTGLGRHEIRKWFADSRYQLRRSGRAWMTGEDRRSRSHRSRGRFKRGREDGVPSSGLYECSKAVGLEAGDYFELDVDVEDKQDPVETLSESREEEEREDMELEVGQSTIKQERKENVLVPSPSPASSSSRSSPSPSFLYGRPLSSATEPYLRKKTQHQLDVLRRSFLHCQWPTSEDYTILQQKTGLTRTEIVQWYGDTRYHVKHSTMRWMTPEDRERVMVGLSKQQRRGGRRPRSKICIDPDPDFREPRSSNGRVAGGGDHTWGESSPSVLPGGEL